MLYLHQRNAVDFAMSRSGNVFLNHEVGCGKTFTALTLFSELKKKTPNLKLLVIAPISILESAWGEDIKKFTRFKYLNLRKGKVIDHSYYDIYMINYEMYTSRRDTREFQQLFNAPLMVAIDESSRMKNPKALFTKQVLKDSSLFKHKACLSGTPAPNGLWELWAQVTFINPDVLPKNFFRFRSLYFHLERGGAVMDIRGAILSKAQAQQLFSRGWKYSITEAKKQALMNAIAPVMNTVKKKDCLDLPDQVDLYREIQMTPQHRKAYNELKKNLVLELEQGECVGADIAIKKIMKLRQITSGFIINDDGKATDLPWNPKLEELHNVIEEIGDAQAIIWADFTHEIEKLCSVFEGKASRLDGSVKDREKEINDFKSGKHQLLIAHPRCAGHGLTLTNASVQIFYSLNYSFELYDQCRGRIHRMGQTEKCSYIHLVTPETIDVDMLACVQQKKTAHEILTGYVRDFNKERHLAAH
jgi:SNF2 family DNA or RNA helicase